MLSLTIIGFVDEVRRFSIFAQRNLELRCCIKYCPVRLEVKVILVSLSVIVYAPYEQITGGE